ncbi:L7Ae/L30e/S12e/Gadd45 family ribosomal protein [Paenibacillus sp. Soil522]|jgi:ribosomal protein L7Ae-like RNA K-turn-binding protein|uniref:L7Ae/L30e/S12e/Gadd45 family ribosomal protein n=1 Tax=Paenibacillus sp. Soil522 TaxID=1736388 RepID=UPI0006F8B5C5|nr:ribosomal L7Ae/L30e/S12e/Gadd45 family protein [Paenibacillus sp. Soil522]KRE39882.1 50S ribosomal protein L7ae [Paenibacillus sp. Soil522]HTG67786.1 ribosomal L7Ae/L30e/S12e/Gadd45 family protein [Candidatus Udaeobacter sp.]
MKQNKSLSQLGMAMRAGKLITGDEIVLKAVRSKQVHLVIIAGDASENTKKKFRDKCNTYGIQLAEAFDREQLGKAIGKPERVVIAVTDAQFGKMIASHLSHNTEVDHIGQ